MKEIYVSAYELSQITGKPLPQILQDLKNGFIKTDKGLRRLPYADDSGYRIPLSQFYPDSWNDL